jgi:hypothetical protein
MRGGKCIGISALTQLSKTPFGANIKAVSILPASKRAAIVSIATFDFPVPISINSAKWFADHDASKAFF